MKPLKPSPSVGTRIPFDKPNPDKFKFRDFLAFPFAILGLLLLTLSVYVGGSHHARDIHNAVKEMGKV